METIPKADCEKIGFFRKTHGVHGQVILEFEPQYEYSVEEAERFFVELEGLLVPFFLTENGLRIKAANSAIVSFDDVETERYAKRLIGSSVYLFHSEIIDEPENSSSELIDYLVLDNKNGVIGRIIQMDDFSGNIVLTVDYNGHEILIPFNEDLLLESNDLKKTIKLQLPEGLLDL